VEWRWKRRGASLPARGDVLGLALPLALAACTVGPSYAPPAPELPAGWSEAPSAPVEPIQWWRSFDDPLLSSLIERALVANLDLRIAEARVREARALRGVAGAARWPVVDASGSYRHTHRAERETGEGDPDPTPGDSSRTQTRNSFQAALGALFDLDVFGGIRRSVEAAEADVDASLEAESAVRVQLIGDVAGEYVELRALQGELLTTVRNLDAQRETLELTEARLRAGLASDLDVERARALVATTSSELPALGADARASAYRLGVLLGASPAELLGELGAAGPIPRAPADVAAGLPLDLLTRRPDIRQAERELAAATARIGAAEAELYPRFTLVGTVGLASGDAIAGSSLFSSLGPSVDWPVFAGGRIRASVDAQEARRDQAYVRYLLSVRTALEEVEGSWARYEREQERRDALAEAVEANRVAAELATRLYANGLGDFLEVLDAERAQLVTERLLTRSDASLAAHLVDLYVALGGDVERAGAVP
jgi:outer membrane protein, multidrug efflux system